MPIAADFHLTLDSSLGGLRTRAWLSPGATWTGICDVLFVLDAREYFEWAFLLDRIYELVTAGKMRPVRVIGIEPMQRNDDFAASAAFADMLVERVVYQAIHHAPTGKVWAMADSLAAAQLVLIQLRLEQRRLAQPKLNLPVFAGLVLQSGAFFRGEQDESSYLLGEVERERLWRFVASLAHLPDYALRCPIRMTCGVNEGNYDLNVEVRGRLLRQGRDVSLYTYDVPWEHERGGHCWHCWGNALVSGGFTEMIGK